MIYRGRLSPGCALCRTRRLKCDRRRPSCSQCLRIKRSCSGYRDLTALRLYDQSEEVIVKAKPQHTATTTTPNLSSHFWADQQILLIPTPLSVSVDDQAISYTFRYFIGSHRSWGIFPFISQLLGTDPSPSLTALIKALGLAMMSNRRKSPGVMLSAYREYSVALAATNSALQDPIRCKSDSTLASVMLLGMYEIITCRASDLMGGWVRHAQGAMKLIELRGVNQLKTPAGLELFSQIRMQIAISNIFYKQYSSSVMAQLSKEAIAYGDSKSQVMDIFYDILTQVVDLSATISDSSTQDTSFGNAAFFIQKALHLDAALVSWASSIDPTWRYTVLITPPLHKNERDDQTYRFVYGSTYHTYPVLALASIWNTYRLTRIILCKIIGSSCKSILKRGTFPEKRLTIFESVAIINQMAGDICASVPWHFTSDETAVGGLIRLLWPLFIASDCVESEPRMKNWILQTLDRIGHTTGIQQAFMMSQLSREGNAHSITEQLDKEDKIA